MTITYPLALPVHTGMAEATLRMVNTNAISESPFTGVQQVQSYSRQRWEVDVTLPPLARADADGWSSWLAALRGKYGTFLIGDPMGVAPRGLARPTAANLLKWTDDLTNAVWNKSGGWTATPAGSGVFDPLGGFTATTITTGGVGQVTQILTATGSGTQTYRLWVRYGNMSSPVMQFTIRNTTTATNLVSAVLTFATMSVAFSGANGTGSYVNYPNGWVQITMTVTSGVTSADTLTYYIGTGSVAGLTYHIWHPQYENGAATDYQPIAAAYAPAVNGAGQTGNTLTIDAASPSQIGFLLPGDYIQLGTGSAARLFKVLNSVNTDAAGNASIDIWPSLRSSPADNAALVVYNAQGVFRLMSNEQGWSTNSASLYGISFTAMEAI